MKTNQEINSTNWLNDNVLITFVRESGATESNPVTLGNVQFWMDAPSKRNGFNSQMSFSLPLSQWDGDAIKADLTRNMGRQLDPLNPGFYKSQRIMDEQTVRESKKAKSLNCTCENNGDYCTAHYILFALESASEYLAPASECSSAEYTKMRLDLDYAIARARRELKPRCAPCNEIGLYHCSDPVHCGQMR